MREEDSPAIANVVVEGDLAVGGIGSEVGGGRAETETIQSVKLFDRGVKEIDKE